MLPRVDVEQLVDGTMLHTYQELGEIREFQPGGNISDNEGWLQSV